MASDWRFNNDTRSGRVRCHGRGDLVMGANRDWSRVSGNAAIMQKLILLFNIPKGEVLNEPGLGCSLQSHLFDKLTSRSLHEIGMELEYDLQHQIPELGVQMVKAAPDGSGGEVKLTIFSATGAWVMIVNRDELMDINLTEEFGVI